MEREDIFEKFINSVNVNAVDPFNPEVQITSRTIQGFAFGLEANFQVRYCCGGYYMGGWIGQMKFRIYGNYNGWVCYTSPIDDNLDLGIAQLKVAAAALSQDEVLNVHEMAGSDIKILYEVMHIRLKDIRLEK